MYDNENISDTTSLDFDPSGRDRRVLLVGHTLAGAILARRLDEQGWAVTVAPGERPGECEKSELTPVSGRADPPKAIDSNQLGVRAVFDGCESAYYDLAVGVTGNRQFLDGQNLRRVAVVPTFGTGSVVDTATALVTLAALAKSLSQSRSVPSALERYRRWRRAIHWEPDSGR